MPVVENTVPVSSPVSSPVVSPTSSKPNNSVKIIAIIVIIGVVLVCCVSAVAGYVYYSIQARNNGNPTVVDGPTATTNPTDDLSFPDGTSLPPISNSFTSSLIPKTRLLTSADGFTTLVAGLGNPSYTVSFLYKRDWTTGKREINTLILNDSIDATLEYGVLLFPKGDSLYNKSCKEIVESLFSSETPVFQTNGSVPVNGENWDGVNYTLDVLGVPSRGHDECLKRPEGTIDFFVVAAESTWLSGNGEIFDRLLGDIYVSDTANSW